MAVEESHEDVKRRGRRVVATTALQPGDAIYATPPDLAVLYSPFAGHICARCLVAEVKLEEKTNKNASSQQQQQQRAKAKSQPRPVHAPRGSTPAIPVGTSSLSSSSLAAPEVQTGSAGEASAPVVHDAYVCPSCDQFVLCSCCVGQLLHEVEMMAAEDALRERRLWKGTLAEHPLLRAHALSCAWYTSLPESIRAPGNDTDFLRFCLDYGARVQLGDTAMVSALAKLDTNAAVQSKEAHHLCEVFARDRVVATFGPRRPPATATATTTAATPPPPAASSVLQAGNHRGGSPAVSALSTADRSGATADKAGSTFPPPYPVSWTDLRDVLLRTRCNSLGFPFTPAETIGWSLQETVCMLNHSCVPNAAVVMLYDTDDATRAQAGPPADEGAEGDDAAAGGRRPQRDRLSPHPQSLGQRRLSRLSVSPTRTNSSRVSPVSSGKNMNSFRAIAVSSTSSFSTNYSESLQGWIGIQATRPIAAGEEITVSYIDLGVYGDDVQSRSRHLLEQYRFLCTCELCTRQRGRKV